MSTTRGGRLIAAGAAGAAAGLLMAGAGETVSAGWSAGWILAGMALLAGVILWQWKDPEERSGHAVIPMQVTGISCDGVPVELSAQDREIRCAKCGRLAALELETREVWTHTAVPSTGEGGFEWDK